MDQRAGTRRLLTAEILSIGSELTVGDTRDTNAGELARALTLLGVEVRRLTGLPDRLDLVSDAFRAGLKRADLVLSTGGLGPTPDDLTREAIAAVCDETPIVDAELETWLRGLWTRRALPFPAGNLKQAWLIPSAEALPNPNGTAPGWFVRRPDGRVVVALPGPPREMRPMWTDEVRPRLAGLGVGADVASRTYRLAGIGESQVAELLGERLLRATNPIVATYARLEAVDVRVSAVGSDDRSADSLVEPAATVVLERLGGYVWATGETTWSDAIGERLTDLGWTLSIVEVASAGRFAALLGDVPWVRRAETRLDGSGRLVALAQDARSAGGTDVGLAMRVRPHKGDTAVSVAVVTPIASHQERRLVFLDGPNGRSRAALAAAAILLSTLSAS